MAKAPQPAEPVVRSAHENNLLDMLGDDLGGAVKAARDRLGDETIMVRIGGHDRERPQPGLVHIERGDPLTVVEHSLTHEEAVALLGALD